MISGSLTLLDELVLLGLRDGSELSAGMPLFISHLVVAGAVLLELELRGSIDSDPSAQTLTVTTNETQADPILAEAMEWISAKGIVSVRETLFWLALRAKKYRALTLHGLVLRGIIGIKVDKLFWIIPTTRYPTLQAEPQLAVKARLSLALYSEMIVDPRDSAIVSLSHASGLLDYLYRSEELNSLKPRLTRMRRFELICRVVDEIAMDVEIDRAAFVGFPHL
jgi:Golgi phosphoprotein 3 (GPP34)